MNYATEYITRTLKASRKSKGLSQRELSAKSGSTQGQISKIENGAVDLRVSSLVALARALDLELTLVPRKSVPAVQSIIRSSTRGTLPGHEAWSQARKALVHLQNVISRLPAGLLAKNELEQFRRQVRELQNLRLSQSSIEFIKNASKTLKAITNSPEGLSAIRQTLSQFQELRNALVHGLGYGNKIEPVRPAYSLDEDENG